MSINVRTAVASNTRQALTRQASHVYTAAARMSSSNLKRHRRNRRIQSNDQRVHFGHLPGVRRAHMGGRQLRDRGAAGNHERQARGLRA